MGGHTEAMLRALPAGPRRRTGPRPAGARARRRRGSAPFARPHHLRARRVRRAPRRARPARHPRRSRACCSTSASRRSSSTRRSAASPTPQDAPLDMRMDPTTGQTAAEVLNTYSERSSPAILRAYGEERFARRIAAAIVRERATAPFDASAGWSSSSAPRSRRAARRTGGNPAKRTFQALRIEVNDELGCSSARCRPRSTRSRVGGRIVVDVVPLARGPARSSARSPPVATSAHRRTCPSCRRTTQPELRLVTRGAEQADAAEVAAQPARRVGAASAPPSGCGRRWRHEHLPEHRPPAPSDLGVDCPGRA